MTAFLVVAWGNAILLELLFALPSNAVHLPMFQTAERGAFSQLSLLSCWQRRQWSEIQSLSQPPNLRPHAQKSLPLRSLHLKACLIVFLHHQKGAGFRASLRVLHCPCCLLPNTTLPMLPAPKYHAAHAACSQSHSVQTQLQSWSRAWLSGLLSPSQIPRCLGK